MNNSTILQYYVRFDVKDIIFFIIQYFFNIFRRIVDLENFEKTKGQNAEISIQVMSCYM